MSYFLMKKKSKIHGFGIFTKKDLEKGVVFYKIPLTKIYDKPKDRCAYIGKNKWVSDNKILNWINHSCEANTILKIKGKSPVLITKKDIKAGEEITCNYNLTEINGSRVKCFCKSKSCGGYFLRK